MIFAATPLAGRVRAGLENEPARVSVLDRDR